MAQLRLPHQAFADAVAALDWVSQNRVVLDAFRFDVGGQLTGFVDAVAARDRGVMNALAVSQARDLVLVRSADLRLVEQLESARVTWASQFESLAANFEAAYAPLRSLELTLLAEQVAGVTVPRAFVDRFPGGLGGGAARSLVLGRRTAAELKELSPADLEARPSPAASVFAQVTLVGVVSGVDADEGTATDVNEQRGVLLAESREALEERLSGEPVLLQKLRGCRAAIASPNNPDRAAQFSVSMRGLLQMLLERLVPLEELAAWAASVGLYTPGQKGGPTVRQNRLRFLGRDYESGPLGKFAVANASAGAQLIGLLDELVHRGGTLNDDELTHLQLHAELLVWSMIEHARFKR